MNTILGICAAIASGLGSLASLLAAVLGYEAGKSKAENDVAKSELETAVRNRAIETDIDRASPADIAQRLLKFTRRK